MEIFEIESLLFDNREKMSDAFYLNFMNLIGTYYKKEEEVLLIKIKMVLLLKENTETMDTALINQLLDKIPIKIKEKSIPRKFNTSFNDLYIDYAIISVFIFILCLS